DFRSRMPFRTCLLLSYQGCRIPHCIVERLTKGDPGGQTTRAVERITREALLVRGEANAKTSSAARRLTHLGSESPLFSQMELRRQPAQSRPESGWQLTYQRGRARLA